MGDLAWQREQRLFLVEACVRVVATEPWLDILHSQHNRCSRAIACVIIWPSISMVVCRQRSVRIHFFDVESSEMPVMSAACVPVYYAVALSPLPYRL